MPERDILKEANALVDYKEQRHGIGDQKISEVSFDVEDREHFAADIINLVKRALETETGDKK